MNGFGKFTVGLLCTTAVVGGVGGVSYLAYNYGVNNAGVIKKSEVFSINDLNTIGDLFTFARTEDNLMKVTHNEVDYIYIGESVTKFSCAGGEEANLCSEFIDSTTGNKVLLYYTSTKLLYIQTQISVDNSEIEFNQRTTYTAVGEILEQTSPFELMDLVNKTYTLPDNTKVTSTIDESNYITVNFKGNTYTIGKNDPSTYVDNLVNWHGSLSGDGYVYTLGGMMSNICLFIVDNELAYIKQDINYSNGTIIDLYSVNGTNLILVNNQQNINDGSIYTTELVNKQTSLFKIVQADFVSGYPAVKLVIVDEASALNGLEFYGTGEMLSDIYNTNFKFANGENSIIINYNRYNPGYIGVDTYFDGATASETMQLTKAYDAQAMLAGNSYTINFVGQDYIIAFNEDASNFTYNGNTYAYEFTPDYIQEIYYDGVNYYTFMVKYAEASFYITADGQVFTSELCGTYGDYAKLEVVDVNSSTPYDLNNLLTTTYTLKGSYSGEMTSSLTDGVISTQCGDYLYKISESAEPEYVGDLSSIDSSFNGSGECYTLTNDNNYGKGKGSLKLIIVDNALKYIYVEQLYECASQVYYGTVTDLKILVNSYSSKFYDLSEYVSNMAYKSTNIYDVVPYETEDGKTYIKIVITSADSGYEVGSEFIWNGTGSGNVTSYNYRFACGDEVISISCSKTIETGISYNILGSIRRYSKTYNGKDLIVDKTYTATMNGKTTIISFDSTADVMTIDGIINSFVKEDINVSIIAYEGSQYIGYAVNYGDYTFVITAEGEVIYKDNIGQVDKLSIKE